MESGADRPQLAVLKLQGVTISGQSDFDDMDRRSPVIGRLPKRLLQSTASHNPPTYHGLELGHADRCPQRSPRRSQNIYGHIAAATRQYADSPKPRSASEIGWRGNEVRTDNHDPDDLAAFRQTLADLLATLRKEAGLTQQQVADRLGYSRATVAGAETGHRQLGEAFWAGCDDLLAPGGQLRSAYAQLAAARRELVGLLGAARIQELGNLAGLGK